ncbi:hypothetical protein PENTCL1PPCAC_14582, partial [Pristionchus entomophagus]
SALTPQEWTEIHGKRNFFLGAWSMIFPTVCHILYLPSLRVFYRERRSTCFKIMLFLAMADMGALITTGTAFGYVSFNGMHFCSNVLLVGINGCAAFCFWYSSTCACALLVINRICELTDRGIWFQGWRSSLCLLAILVYSYTNGLFSRPVLANSVHETIALDPFIPGHSPAEVRSG